MKQCLKPRECTNPVQLDERTFHHFSRLLKKTKLVGGEIAEGILRQVVSGVVDPDPHGMDPELLPKSGSGIKVPDQDPAKSERAYK